MQLARFQIGITGYKTGVRYQLFQIVATKSPTMKLPFTRIGIGNAYKVFVKLPEKQVSMSSAMSSATAKPPSKKKQRRVSDTSPSTIQKYPFGSICWG